MGEKIVVGPINKGLRNDRTAFVIDNDSFPTLINAYQWRGRVKRKRGTSFLNRLTRFFDSTSTAYSSTSTFALVAGEGNILTGFSLQINGNIVPGSVTITDITSGAIYTDTPMDGTLLKNGLVDPGSTINYATGAITIDAGGADLVSAVFRYYPDLAVMGLEDYLVTTSAFAQCLAFDTTYSYLINNSFPYPVHDVSFYKNPEVDGTNLPGYMPKTTWTPTTWTGQDYQQFWTVNYADALWATNGMEVPFVPSQTTIRMPYVQISAIAIVTPTQVTITTTTNHGLVIGDFVFINEIVGMTGINFQSGYVTFVGAVNQITVDFPFATIAGIYSSGGIVQFLTSRSATTKDCIRWFDGDPTDGNAVTPGFNRGNGWVNFCPPLSQDILSISGLPAAIYYLVGCKMIVPFKDRLLFIGVVVQTSDPVQNPIYLQDTIVYSQNGTPYYTASFTNNPTITSATTVFHQILVPDNQTATAPAYFADSAGFGGFIVAGVDLPMTTSSSNEDVIIIGFPTIQTRLIYSGNDLLPFNLYTINSELGSGSTFSVINMDKGVLTVGERGFVVTGQTEAKRFDLDIPDQIFKFSHVQNGIERVCAQRDYINEWSYFTYPLSDRVKNPSDLTYKFPNQTLQYNYRDDSWAIFNECYTTYGGFRKQTGFTWATVGSIYPNWKAWNDPWNAGTSTLLQPNVIAGNQQGFVIVRDDGTNESNSLYIRNISGPTVTCPNHCLNEGDYITISGAIGTVAANVNDKIFSVSTPITVDTFRLNPIPASGTYLGGGLIKRMYVPLIQTKQFPVAWELARKTRLGPQQYLFSTTSNAQIQLLIYLSQDGDNPYNLDPIVPATNVNNSSLVYSTALYTCPESTNLGLTPANTNLNMLTASQQAQTWHRMNTSLIGDTVQIGFTLSDEQMRTVDVDGLPISQFAEIELHGFILDVQPSMLLA